MSTAWKRLSDAELQLMRISLYQESPVMITIEQAQRLLNERDALEHAMLWTQDGQAAMNEFLLLMEHCSKIRAENHELKRKLAEMNNNDLSLVG